MCVCLQIDIYAHTHTHTHTHTHCCCTHTDIHQDFLSIMGVGARRSTTLTAQAQRRRPDASPTSELTLVVVLAVGKLQSPAHNEAMIRYASGSSPLCLP